MNQILLNLVLALATNELFHNILEPISARGKVKRLKSYIENKPYKEMKLNINTRVKSYAISLVGLVAPVGILWAVYSFLDIKGNTALRLIVAMLVLSFVSLAVLMDKYHVDIEQVTKKFKK